MKKNCIVFLIFAFMAIYSTSDAKKNGDKCMTDSDCDPSARCLKNRDGLDGICVGGF